MKAISTVLLGAFLSVTSIAIAAGWTFDPVVGTWKLNATKSKFIHGPVLKSGTRIYKESRDGMMSVTVKSLSADGKETTLMRAFKQDGKDYPVTDSSGVDSISEVRINSHTAAYKEKKAGKTTLTGRRVLSKDGKMLTVTERGADEDGARLDYTLVYDRE